MSLFDKLLELTGVKEYHHKGKKYFYWWQDEDFSNEDYIAVYDSDLELIGNIELSCWSSHNAGIKKINKLIDTLEPKGWQDGDIYFSRKS